ncbi:MAG TPA: toll/interleukin-1 receptor domain-containing protein [Actinomycetota bacterium]|nr:toll/interleukin-1 receptor domain-containing protein [Actinomycetota bacterium]
MSEAAGRPDVRIFISYRRDDAAGHAGRLYDALVEHYGEDKVFMDLAVIEPGVDFVDVIHEGVGSCDVVLTLIGRNWLAATDAKGRRRLENPEDFVRLELETALHREIRVIPLLVQGAQMPGSDELPATLSRLARRNGLELSDPRWSYDVGRLIVAIDRIATEKASRVARGGPAATEPPTIPPVPPPPGPATVPIPPMVAPPPGTPSAPPARGRARNVVPIVAGVVVLAGVVLLVVFLGGGGDERATPTTAPPSTAVSPSVTTSPSPTTSATPSDAAAVGQQFLLDHVPADHVDSCAADTEFLPDGATAGIKCSPNDNVTFWYYLYSGDTDLQAWYSKRLGDESITRDVGDCQTDDTSESQLFVAGEATRGRFVCYTDENGRWVEWTRPELLIYGYLNRPDGKRQATYDFWSGAGPTV